MDAVLSRCRRAADMARLLNAGYERRTFPSRHGLGVGGFIGLQFIINSLNLRLLPPQATLEVSGTALIISNTTISGSLQIAGGAETCNGPEDIGKMRYNSTYASMEICR